MNGKSKRESSMFSEGSKASVDGSRRLDKETQTKIGQQLRAMYDEVVRQGVPDRFTELLKQLEERDDDKEPKS
jgi:hypothetical protein